MLVVVLSGSELIVRGVATVLQPFGGEVEVTESLSRTAEGRIADVALLDVEDVGRSEDLVLRVKQILTEDLAAKVALLTWDQSAAAVEAADVVGASGSMFKGLSADAMVAAVLAIHRGEVLPSQPAAVPPRRRPRERGRGCEVEDLSERELQILSYVGAGMSNDQIAADLFLSINTIKSYIRSAYTKLGATSRSQAVVWAVEHRLADPASPHVGPVAGTAG